MDVIYGAAGVIISRNPMENPTPDIQYYYSGGDNPTWTAYNPTARNFIEWCPEDDKYFIGTVFIGVSCLSTDACVYSLKLESLPVGNTRKPVPACTDPEPDENFCLDAGVPKLFAPKGPQDEVYFEHVVPSDAECINGRFLVGFTYTSTYFLFHTISLSFDSAQPWRDFSALDPKTGMPHGRAIPDWTNIGSQGKMYAAFSFDCNDRPDTIYGTIYTIFKLNPGFTPNFKITIQTDPHFITLFDPFTLGEWAFPLFLLDSIKLVCPGGVEHIPCNGAIH